MKLINRYLLSTFLHILLLTLASFTGIYLLIDFFEKIGTFLDHRASANQYLSFLLNSIPIIISQVLPLAVLMTMVLTLGSLGRTNEITAMRACGLSLWRIIRALMVLALLVSGLQLIVNEELVPINARNLNQLLEVELQGKSRQALAQGKIWYRDQGRIIHIVQAEPQGSTLQGVTIYQLDGKARLERRLTAATARYRQGGWRAATVTIMNFDPVDGDLLQSDVKNDQVLELGRSPEDFSSGSSKNNEMTFKQLSRLVRKLQAEGFDATRHLVDMHGRLAAPFTCLIMAFLGVPFALQRGRGSSIAVGIGLSLGIGVIYFILQSLVLAFGYSGALAPVVAAWAVNVIFLLVGIWLLLNIRD